MYLIVRGFAWRGPRTLEVEGEAQVFGVPTYAAGYYLLTGIPVFEYLPVFVSVVYPTLSVMGSDSRAAFFRTIFARGVWWQNLRSRAWIITAVCFHIAEVRNPGFALEV